MYGAHAGKSLFSPLLKSLMSDNQPAAILRRGRSSVMHRIEERFRFLAVSADVHLSQGLVRALPSLVASVLMCYPRSMVRLMRLRLYVATDRRIAKHLCTCETDSRSSATHAWRQR
jgi:hypothetical protein